MKNKKNKAFTLAETLITLVLLGIIASITIPSILSARPNKNKMLFKKAYFTLEQTVSNLINSEIFYPDKFDFDGNIISGFKNTDEVDGCAGANKFECLFKKQLNLVDSEVKCPSEAEGTVKQCFEGNDGIIWKIEGSFVSSDENTVTFDVNGAKGQNSEDEANNRDTFHLIVHSDGRIEVPDDSQTKEYLRSTSALK